jgi:hypothetical protein
MAGDYALPASQRRSGFFAGGFFTAGRFVDAGFFFVPFAVRLFAGLRAAMASPPSDYRAPTIYAGTAPPDIARNGDGITSLR